MAIVPDGSGNNPGNPVTNLWDGTDDHIPSQRELQRLFWESQVGSVDVDIVLTTPYIVVPEDRLKVKLFNNASPVEVVLPANAPVNFSFIAYQLGTGQVYAVLNGAATNNHASSHNAVSGQYGQVKWTVVANPDGNSAVWEPTGDTALYGPNPGDVTSPTFLNANSANVAENQQLAFTVQVDEPAYITISGGTDADDFEVFQPSAPSTTATLRWVGNNTKNFEAPTDSNANNIYIVQLTATDPSSNASNQTIQFTVTDVAEGGGDTTPPAFLSASSGIVQENATLAHTIQVDEASTITIVGGADAAKFEIVQASPPSTTATLRFASNGTKNYEAPDDADSNNTYVVQVRATDAASNFTNQTITYTVTDVVEGGGTTHHPAPVNATWVERYWRDFQASEVISINEGQSDNAIIADKGEFKEGTLRYREGGQNGGTYNKVGIPGWGYDVFVDSTAVSLLPTEYLKERPTGEVEVIPGVGVRLHARASTGPELTAILNSQFGDVNGAAGKGVALHSSAHIASYWKIECEPPFARYTKFIARHNYNQGAFAAALWSVEAGNRAYPNDTVEIPLEIDDQEFLGYPNPGDMLGSSSSFKGHSGTYNGAIGGDGTTNHGDPVGIPIEVCTILESNYIQVWFRVNGGTWQSRGQLTLTQMQGANYQQAHLAFIQNLAWGHFWRPASENPTGDLALDIVADGVWVPSTNATYVGPDADPPGKITLNWTAPDPIPENTTGKLADLVVPADVDTIKIITAFPSRLQIVGTGTARELHVGSAGLKYADQPTLKFALQGQKATGHKSRGRVYSRGVSDVVGYPSAWWNSNAIAEVRYDLNAGFIAGTGETTVAAVHAPGGNITAALRSAMNVSSYVIMWEFDGALAEVKGLFGNNSDFFHSLFQGQLTPPRVSLKVGASTDQFADIAGYVGDKGDPCRVAFTTGVGGSKIAASYNNTAGAAVASTTERPTQAFTGGNMWDSGFGDFDLNANKLRLLIIAPQHVGGSAGNVLTDAQLQSLVQNGV